MIVVIVIIIFILVSIFWMIFFKNRIEPLDLNPIRIDAVISWVNGKDDAFRKQVLKHNNDVFENERFDMNEELRFCLRSLEKNMRFIHKIYIVIQDAQFPHFLKKFHYQIEYIQHSKIIPKQYLPTFNSISIENFIHKIPNLSEHFIYFNDDMIVLKDCDPFLFFNAGNVIHTRDALKNHETRIYTYWSINENNTIFPLFKPRPFHFTNFIEQNNELLDLFFWKEKRYRSQHIPYSCRISYLDELDELIKTVEYEGVSLYEHSGMYKFRDMRSIARFSIFKKYFEMHMHGSIEKTYPLLAIVINEKQDKSNEINQIKHSNDRFLVIHNEVLKENDTSITNFQALNHVLQELFPLKSSFEI